LSIASVLLFRSPLMRWMKLDGPGASVDSLVGETAIALEDIRPGSVGRAELRGTVWSARNNSRAVLVKGQRCTVAAVDRLTIFLVPEGAST
jgi:membrane protein implicated in regulation of membrane protease activity